MDILGIPCTPGDQTNTIQITINSLSLSYHIAHEFTTRQAFRHGHAPPLKDLVTDAEKFLNVTLTSVKKAEGRRRERWDNRVFPQVQWYIKNIVFRDPPCYFLTSTLVPILTGT